MRREKTCWGSLRGTSDHLFAEYQHALAFPVSLCESINQPIRGSGKNPTVLNSVFLEGLTI
jgi:hypothetical protein